MKRIISFFLFLFFCFHFINPLYAELTRFPVVIAIQAGSPELEENIRLYVETQMRLHAALWTEAAAKQFLKTSEKDIVQAIFPYGYFHPKIQTRFTSARVDGKNVWRLTYEIIPDTRIKWRYVHLRVQGDGVDNAKLKKAMQNFLVKSGNAFNTIQYEKAKDEWLRVAANQGYVNAYFSEKKIKINSKEQWADVFLTLDTGFRYYFGRLHLQSKAYSTDFLKRFLNIHTQDPFSSKKLVQLEERMNSSGYFKQVIVDPQFEQEELRRVPVEITVAPPASQRYKLGVGFGSYSGARVSAEAGFPHLNEKGHQLTTRIQLSTILSILSAKYTIPGTDPVTDQYSLGVRAQKFRPEKGNSFNHVLSLGYGSTGKRLTYNATLNYLREHYTINKDQPNEYSGNSYLFYPAVSVNYIHADDILNPQQGYGMYLNAQAGSHAVLSSTDFFQVLAKGKYIYSFLEGRDQILMRAGIGYTAVRDLTQLPLSMRFFAGGDATIRGYTDSSIGPGRYLQYVGGEYRHRIFTENWKAALFWDGGKAGDHFRSPFVNSYGAGLIYQSVIGPLRFYLASVESNLNTPPTKRKLAFDFSFGAEFS